ncbi:Metallo-dependent phosphatase [Venustampulla echinocandica]|uniref:Metallo-dependent phosphatase n=1 Tax=Venustampulla echinocandica TaxID=2656787 RepID=A0A370TFA9_9HELO|nr:Metallo-dependent phosphatase [Venustampulla echinocandica]RDL33350.1 Metallo-dependent phosphatase [Venustampulla echinocandica]
MFPAAVLRIALLILVPVSFILSSYLYLYPIFHLCAFPSPEHAATSSFSTTVRQHIPFSRHDPKKIAPFRLLALGDPQLEGNSPLRDRQAQTFPNFSKFWKDALLLDGTRHNPLQRVRHSLHDLIDFYLDDIPSFFELFRKRLDHIGNDYYLGHIYRTLNWWADPTHVTVLGDLVGSQWIDDEEFENRGWRYWNRVVRGGVRVPDELTTQPSEASNSAKILGDDAAAWKKRIINVAGNHDIGYAGDLSPARMERFVRVFGKANYELRFQMPVDHASATQENVENVENDERKRPVPELRIIVLNDMNLDTPASSKELQDETYHFLNEVITASQDVSRPAHFTLVLTHIPLYKKEGICVDGPFFSFFNGHFDNGIQEQNHLSRDASKGFLEGIFGMSAATDAPGQGFGRHGLVINGHDHEGCDIYHYINQTAPPEQEWLAMRWKDAHSSRLDEEPGVPGLREITVRSMMGGFAGNAGLLSLWFDEETWDWNFEFANCGLGTQHIWWLVHILDLITLAIGIVYSVMVGIRSMIPVEDPVFMMERMGNGKVTMLKIETATEGKGGNGNEITVAGLMPTSGKLDVPGAGKKSLRKKKSGRILNGTLNGSSPPR